MEYGDNGHRKLIRCNVLNPFNVPSVRFVDLESFKLWEYMMQHKHGIKVVSASLCLWVNESTYFANEALYSRAGDVEQVNQIVVTIFDDVHHYMYRVYRYALAVDSERVKDIILSHTARELTDSDRLEVTVDPGYCIEKQKTKDMNQFVLGLTGAWD